MDDHAEVADLEEEVEVVHTMRGLDPLRDDPAEGKHDIADSDNRESGDVEV